MWFSNCNFPIHVLKPLSIEFKALMIIEIIANLLHCQSLPISVLKSLYRSFFQFHCSAMLHQLYHIFMSSCQQLWCLVCCVSVYGRFVQRNPTVSLHFYFKALFLVGVHPTWFQLEIHILCTSPNEQPHQLYHAS